MPRKKKYVKIKDLTELNTPILDILLDDVEQHKNKLVKYEYTITTNGGDGILWQVNEKDYTNWTVSTQRLGYASVRPGLSVPVYKHYVLTEKGIRYIKNLIVEHSI